MTAFRKTISRLGRPDAVSWPAFWLTSVVNAFTAYLGGTEINATVAERTMVFVLSQLGFFGIAVLYRKVVLERSPASPWRPVATLAVFALAGGVRGLIAGAVLVQFAGAGGDAVLFRVVASVGISPLVMSLIAIGVSTLRDYRRTRQELLARREQLVAAHAKVIQSQEQRTAEILAGLRSELAGALAAVSPTDRAGELDRVAAEVVRPMSHELSQQSPSWEPPPSAPQRVRLGDIVGRAVREAPLVPIATAVIAIAVLTMYSWEGVKVATLPWYAGAAVLTWLGLSLIARLMRNRMAASALISRAIVTVASLALVGLSAGLVLEAASDWSNRTSLPFFGPPVMCFVGLLLSLARATGRELNANIDDLAAADGELMWQVKRLHMQEWCSQRRLARALHGRVQAVMAAYAGRLRLHDDVGLDALRCELEAALGDGEDHGDSIWTSGIIRLESTWRGLCTVRREQTSSDLTLDADPLCAEIALEITSEAVSNAVRHGKANDVLVSVQTGPRVAHLTVIDNGRGGAASTAGLGTRLLDDCALAWLRVVDQPTSTLTASLPRIS